MSIIRVQKNKNYSVINNTGLNDKDLSWKAKGLLAYLLSKPDDWEVYVSHLKKQSTDGRDSTAAGLKELENNGYITRRQVKNELNQFTGYEYTIREVPEDCRKPDTENPLTGNAKTENPSLLSTDNNKVLNKVNTDINNNVSTFRADDTLPALSKKDSKYTRWAEAMTLFIERYHHSNYWNFKGKSREKAIQEWPKQIRLLIEKDLHGQGTIEDREKQVKAVIRWVYEQSEFWRHNILSADKLRKQYDKLSAQFEQFKKSAAGKRMVNEAKTKEERIRELEQELIYGRSDK
jgi:hypothetical protein